MSVAEANVNQDRVEVHGRDLTRADYRHAAGNLKAFVSDPAARVELAGALFGATAGQPGDLAIVRPEVTA